MPQSSQNLILKVAINPKNSNSQPFLGCENLKFDLKLQIVFCNTHNYLTQHENKIDRLKKPT